MFFVAPMSCWVSLSSSQTRIPSFFGWSFNLTGRPHPHHHHLPTNQNHRTACSLRFALCLAWPTLSVVGLQILKDQPMGSCYGAETESICPRMGESKAACSVVYVTFVWISGLSTVLTIFFQGENPAVYGGREADNSLTFHRRLQSEYPTTANLY